MLGRRSESHPGSRVVAVGPSKSFSGGCTRSEESVLRRQVISLRTELVRRHPSARVGPAGSRFSKPGDVGIEGRRGAGLAPEAGDIRWTARMLGAKL
jgi:hypothetical protein